MNNDYLWDKSGEPDVEVQELEDVLGTLRYQPQPFVLPEDVRTAGGRKWYPILAIAATIALIALALGIWLRVQRQQPSQPDQFANKNGSAPETVAPKETPGAVVAWSPEPKEIIPAAPRTPRPNRSTLVRHVNRTSPSRQNEQMSAANRAEAEAAKQQLMLALRVVSAKLNFAQRKTVPGNNNIRYQHKVG